MNRISTLAGIATIGFGASFAGAQLSNNSLGQLSGANGTETGTNVSELPETMTLTGIVRDFRADHADFQRQPKNADGHGSFGHYAGIVMDQLDEDGKPVFRSKGYKITSPWLNARGRSVMPGIESRPDVDTKSGDSAGSAEAQGDAVENAETFSQWFRKVPGVNEQASASITLVREAQGNKYIFDDTTDDFFQAQGGFFPINGKLYGDYQNGINYHFTFELDTEFTYESGENQIFRFIGDDDVWVFIDGRLVIDLGGVHSKLEQEIELDRLNWLQDGETYQLKFFFAERHTTQSNFRMETNIALRNVAIPAVSALHD